MAPSSAACACRQTRHMSSSRTTSCSSERSCCASNFSGGAPVSYSVNLHLPNENPLLGEMEELPKTGNTNVALSNLHKRDGSRVAYLDSHAHHLIFPWHCIPFIDVMPSEAECAKAMKYV